ncbi:hypothetical protein DTO271D3_1650 [Paecilomyces variotii]|nr:hypothetical protein DTO169E5_2540 [Paecilomyces variotii]KAJ9257891.1 hypothetical protein DTO207G8_1668 [Paecilomyces variotii]KAJ9317945.1 hypothetical protein DTO271D3_1650 [Paecilomyces variotii]
MASKRKASDTPAPPASSAQQKDSKVIHFTARNPPWSYLKLQLIPQPGYSSANTLLDELTTRTYLSSALSQFLGVTGTAISIDLLKVENDGTNRYAWIRVPRDDASAVVSAVSSWIGGSKSSGSSGANAGNVAWRVCAKGNFLGALVNGSGTDLFAP